MPKFLDPKTDLTFKRVFGEHKDIMISFLNAMLPLPATREIIDLEYLDPEMVPLNPGKKDSIVDVRCKDNTGRQFIVEMQMYWTNAFKKRALLNTCKAYSMQAERGTSFSELKSVYTLSLVNDIAFPEEKDFYHEFVPTSKNNTKNIIDDFDMIFVELPKFQPHTHTEKKMQVLWLRFLTEIKDHTTEIDKELYSDKNISKAIGMLEESAYTDAQLLAYDKYWDLVSREKTALEEKYSQGVEKGRNEEKMTIARSMKEGGIDISFISKHTGLTVDEINSL